jgi:hypothetical protein
MMLYIANVFVMLLAIAGLVWLSRLYAKKSRLLDATEGALDTVRDHTERQAEEIRDWRTLFGPFVSLYKNGPEATSLEGNSNTIAIDLDGVILEYVEPWTGINHFGEPLPGAAEAIQKLKDLGYKIVIYTTRNNAMAHHNEGQNALLLASLVQNQLEKHGIPYDYISLFKPLARIYIDDRAVRFYDWETTLKNVKNLEIDRILQMASKIGLAIDQVIGVGE